MTVELLIALYRVPELSGLKEWNFVTYISKGGDIMLIPRSTGTNNSRTKIISLTEPKSGLNPAEILLREQNLSQT